ncbi:MAG: hypothetical protein GC159_05125 [Phycisphaera sp.]|nr:hypothetical protein [Phycisphaera sp.]
MVIIVPIAIADADAEAEIAVTDSEGERLVVVAIVVPIVGASVIAAIRSPVVIAGALTDLHGFRAGPVLIESAPVTSVIVAVGAEGRSADHQQRRRGGEHGSGSFAEIFSCSTHDIPHFCVALTPVSGCCYLCIRTSFAFGTGSAKNYLSMSLSGAAVHVSPKFVTMYVLLVASSV